MVEALPCGQLGCFVDEALDLGTLSLWVSNNWSLAGNPRLKQLGGALILFVFDNAKDVEGVWNLGCCTVDGKSLKFDWWSPEAGCLEEWAPVKGAWVRYFGLLLQLWGMEFFKRVGALAEVCGCGCRDNGETTFPVGQNFRSLQWEEVA